MADHKSAKDCPHCLMVQEFFAATAFSLKCPVDDPAATKRLEHFATSVNNLEDPNVMQDVLNHVFFAFASLGCPPDSLDYLINISKVNAGFATAEEVGLPEDQPCVEVSPPKGDLH